MRGHALVLLVLAALVLAPAPRAVTGAASASAGLLAQASADPRLEPGHDLVRRGAYAQAQQFFADAAARYPELAPRALLLQARAALADGDTDVAEATLQELLADNPDSDQTASAYFALEQVRRAAGDCAGALRALSAFEATAGPRAIGPYAALQRAQCAGILGDWPTELSAAQSALAIDGGGPRLAQIEALERAAEADLKLGRTQAALDLYNRCLGLAGTRAYTAEMLFTTARLASALDQLDLATERFRAVVVDYADQARAPAALDALGSMGQAETVSPLQAGLVRLNAHDYPAAIAQFDQVDPSSADWAPAQLHRAEALLKLGDGSDARAGLAAVAAAAPRSPGAASALLRLGQLDERDGDESSAEAHYRAMLQAAPERAAEAWFHVGFARFVRGDSAGGLAAWQAGLASTPATPELLAQVEYWIGRAQPVGSADALEAFNRAAAAAPESFYGLRAQDRLDATLSTAAVPSAGTAWLNPRPSEVQERGDWFAALNLTPESVAEAVDALPGVRRADLLDELGLRTEAGWEIDGLAQSFAQASDVASLSALADWATAHDQPQLTLRLGKQMQALVGLNGLPRSLQKDVYPAPWGDVVAEQAAASGVDPLLVLAVIRQESSFDRRAQSGAQAMGLTQVVPSTARSIASRLGRADFALRDLFRPEVSIQFGTWFLGQLLGEYRGRLFPALAAYDAGSGNLGRWLQRFGDDPDVLVEQIPFSETQSYVRIVYGNYWHYQLLYRAGP